MTTGRINQIAIVGSESGDAPSPSLTIDMLGAPGRPSSSLVHENHPGRPALARNLPNATHCRLARMGPRTSQVP